VACEGASEVESGAEVKIPTARIKYADTGEVFTVTATDQIQLNRPFITLEGEVEKLPDLVVPKGRCEFYHTKGINAERRDTCGS
jgi:hypothetical protein